MRSEASNVIPHLPNGPLSARAWRLREAMRHQSLTFTPMMPQSLARRALGPVPHTDDHLAAFDRGRRAERRLWLAVLGLAAALSLPLALLLS